MKEELKAIRDTLGRYRHWEAVELGKRIAAYQQKIDEFYRDANDLGGYGCSVSRWEDEKREMEKRPSKQELLLAQAITALDKLIESPLEWLDRPETEMEAALAMSGYSIDGWQNIEESHAAYWKDKAQAAIATIKRIAEAKP